MKHKKEKEADKMKECFEWYWFIQDSYEIPDMYFDEDGYPITDDGMVEAEKISQHAWEQFEKLAKEVKDLLKL